MALERLALQLGAVALLVLGAWLWHGHEVSAARKDGDKAGYDRAVAAGKLKYEAERARNLKAERDLREENRLDDEASAKKEAENAENLAAVQARVRAGDDSLRIAIRTIRATATPADRPAAGGPAANESRAELVPEVAAAALGNAAAVAGIVRKFDRVEARFEACRALNNGAAPAEMHGD